MNVDEVYLATLDYLYSFVDYSLSRSFRYSPDKFDLGRMVNLMDRLGSPERSYASIHIAGTKGKGSVAALCSHALVANGYKVGLYTSPHLHDYAERVQVSGQPISHKDLIMLVEEIKPTIESIPGLTTFEITTALAFHYFSLRQLDVAVVEVGLGGRLDATNVLLPDVSVITSLSYDHTYLLGDTLSQIASEKAGIIKPEVPIVVAPQEEEARVVIERIASERSAPLIQVGKDILYRPGEHSLAGQSLQVWMADPYLAKQTSQATGEASENSPISLTIPLLGDHQVVNAATAYATLRVFDDITFAISDEAISRGFAQTSWPGRFEILRSQPPIVVDSAHNRDSANRLRRTLDEYYPGMEIILVFGASEDKDVAGMFAELLPGISDLIVTKSFHPRAMEPEQLMEFAQQYNKPAKIEADVADAFYVALHAAGQTKLVLVTGSLFIVAGAREAWYSQQQIIEAPVN